MNPTGLTTEQLAAHAVHYENENNLYLAGHYRVMLAFRIDCEAAHRTPTERTDLYHTELAEARKHNPPPT